MRSAPEEMPTRPELAPPHFLERERPRIEAALAEIRARAADQIPQLLRGPVEYALSTEGKRIRPVLCILAYRAARGESGAGSAGVGRTDPRRSGMGRSEAATSEMASAGAASARASSESISFGVNSDSARSESMGSESMGSEPLGSHVIPDALYRLSCALELVHTYSLVHDDLPSMDDDDLRRGRATVHRVYGIGAATLAGAALLPLAIRVLEEEGAALGLELEERARLARELTQAAGAEGMVGGQLLDLHAEQRAIDGAELERIHRLKTGALLTSALRIGALAGRATPPLVEALSKYGAALGLAFQIADDLLDVEGTEARLGKAAGRDLALAKASYPSLFGLERARELGRARVEEAKEALCGFELPDLIALADYVLDRRV